MGDHPDELAVVTEVNEDSDEDDIVEDEADSTEDELQNGINRMTFVVGTKKIAALPQWIRVSDVFRLREDGPFLSKPASRISMTPGTPNTASGWPG